MTSPQHDHTRYFHSHRFLGHSHARAERRARLVAGLTFLFMLVEIFCGLWFGSMALLADGMHMATHAGAIGLAALTYGLARRHEGDARFSFGSGKFGDLAAFASAIVLGLLALMVAAQSLHRFAAPQGVAYGEAFVIATIGLGINFVSALLLKDDHDHDHDHNLRAAYVHVLTDALTSVLAMAALAAGYLWGAAFADPLAGLVGAAMIGWWAWGLMRDSALVLLDAGADPELAAGIKSWVEASYAVAVCDFHLWRLGPGHNGLILSLIGSNETDCDKIKRELSLRYASLSHITVESVVCRDCVPR
jgi:cation diffusion facilitator family transporter